MTVCLVSRSSWILRLMHAGSQPQHGMLCGLPAVDWDSWSNCNTGKDICTIQDWKSTLIACKDLKDKEKCLPHTPYSKRRYFPNKFTIHQDSLQCLKMYTYCFTLENKALLHDTQSLNRNNCNRQDLIYNDVWPNHLATLHTHFITWTSKSSSFMEVYTAFLTPRVAVEQVISRPPWSRSSFSTHDTTVEALTEMS